MDTMDKRMYFLDMRPFGNSATLEKRRHRAISLLKDGKSFREVADEVSASLSSVVRWAQAHRKSPRKGLAPKPTPGRPSRLSPSQKKRLVQLLSEGSSSHGYYGEVWTLKRVAQLIKKHFGIDYHPGHVWHLMLEQISWSWQKPERRAFERDEEAIAHWKKTTWQNLKKNRKTQGTSCLSG